MGTRRGGESGASKEAAGAGTRQGPVQPIPARCRCPEGQPLPVMWRPWRISRVWIYRSSYTSPMPELTLFSNPQCRLCEEARQLLQGRHGSYHLKTVEIEGDLALVYRYGVRIPVLRREDSGAELDWPFDEAALSEFLSLPA